MINLEDESDDDDLCEIKDEESVEPDEKFTSLLKNIQNYSLDFGDEIPLTIINKSMDEDIDTIIDENIDKTEEIEIEPTEAPLSPKLAIIEREIHVEIDQAKGLFFTRFSLFCENLDILIILEVPKTNPEIGSKSAK